MAKYIPENAQWADITPLLDEIDSGLKHMRFYDEQDDYSDFLAEEREDLLRLPKAESNTVRAIAHWNHWPCDDEEDFVYHCSNCNEQFYEDFFYPRETPCLSSENISLLNIALIVAQKWKRRCMNENIRTGRSGY